LCEIKDTAIYLGLAMINEVEQQLIHNLLEERFVNGDYTGLFDFVKRVPVSLEQLRLLVRANAFQFTGKNKKELLWEAYSLINPIKKIQNGKELFDVRPKKYKLPELTESWLDDVYDDIELFGFSLCSPFKLLKEKSFSQLKAKDVKKSIGKVIEIMAYLVTLKSTRTSKGEKMYFGTFLDIDGFWIDTVHFPSSAKTYAFQGPGCYKLIGKAVEEFDFVSIEVHQMFRMAMLNRDDAPENENETLCVSH
jgi:DNA polymerase-3 subunit alpha